MLTTDALTENAQAEAADKLSRCCECGEPTGNASVLLCEAHTARQPEAWMWDFAASMSDLAILMDEGLGAPPAASPTPAPAPEWELCASCQFEALMPGRPYGDRCRYCHTLGEYAPTPTPAAKTQPAKQEAHKGGQRHLCPGCEIRPTRNALCVSCATRRKVA